MLMLTNSNWKPPLFAFWISVILHWIEEFLKTRKKKGQFNQFEFSSIQILIGVCSLLHFHSVIQVIGNDFLFCSTHPKSYKRLLRSCTWILNPTTIVCLIIASLITFSKTFYKYKVFINVTLDDEFHRKDLISHKQKFSDEFGTKIDIVPLS